MLLTLDLLRDLKRRFPAIDDKRIYVTGISMGGFGTWDAITREPETFAAAIPICGGGDPATVSRIASLPIWAWHDSGDNVISVNRTRQMVAALRAAGGEPLYTETSQYGHRAWRAAYKHAALLPWLFAHKRS